MGACCGGGLMDEEIKNATNIDELIKVMEEKKERLPKEKQQIEDHIEDPTKEVDMINVGGIDTELLKKRIPFLDELEKYYDKTIQILRDNSSLPLNDCKNYSNDIVNHYVKTYDPNDELKDSYEKFEEFVKKWKKDNTL